MTIVSSSLDDIFSKMPTGSIERSILNNLRGLNFRQTPNATPINKDIQGLTFFTRPQLNMQIDNLRNVRQLGALLTNNPNSIQTYIRCMLDPRLMNGIEIGGVSTPRTPCSIIDNSCAFIPPLTNSLVSMSGWPSIAVPTNTSDPGLYNESQTMVDGRVLNYETFDITANFRNTRGDPILFMFYVWSIYMSMVFEGKLVPYLDMISENEIDYNTRIYRIVLDYKKQIVTKIACTNASIPVGVPVGDAFDVPGDKPYSEANREISMRFKCDGVRYFDPIIVDDFNKTVCIFNPSMYDEYRSSDMVKISAALLDRFNMQRCYPRIDTITMELEWWVSAQDFSMVAQRYVDSIPETNSETFVGD